MSLVIYLSSTGCRVCPSQSEGLLVEDSLVAVVDLHAITGFPCSTGSVVGVTLHRGSCGSFTHRKFKKPGLSETSFIHPSHSNQSYALLAQLTDG